MDSRNYRVVNDNWTGGKVVAMIYEEGHDFALEKVKKKRESLLEHKTYTDLDKDNKSLYASLCVYISLISKSRKLGIHPFHNEGITSFRNRVKNKENSMNLSAKQKKVFGLGQKELYEIFLKSNSDPIVFALELERIIKSQS